MASQEVINLLGSNNFRIVLPTVPSCRISTSEVRITTNKFSFSIATAAEIGYPEYACLLVSDDASKLVIKGCKKLDYAFPFCIRDENGHINKKSISTGNVALSQVIRAKLGWEQKSCYVCSGILYRDEQLILFDLTKAFIRRHNTPKKVVPSDVFASYPPIYEVMQYKPALLPPISQESEDDSAVAV